jgi:hypothetical protein
MEKRWVLEELQFISTALRLLRSQQQCLLPPPHPQPKQQRHDATPRIAQRVSAAIKTQDTLLSAVRDGTLLLPLQTARLESLLLREALCSEVACLQGPDCVGQKEFIRPATVHVTLMKWLTPDEYALYNAFELFYRKSCDFKNQPHGYAVSAAYYIRPFVTQLAASLQCRSVESVLVLVDGIMTKKRLCVLCYRYWTCRVLIEVRNGPLHIDPSWLLQSFRNGADYERNAFLSLPSDNTSSSSSNVWSGFVHPLLRPCWHSLTFVQQGSADQGTQVWFVDQSRIYSSKFKRGSRLLPPPAIAAPLPAAAEAAEAAAAATAVEAPCAAAAASAIQ